MCVYVSCTTQIFEDRKPEFGEELEVGGRIIGKMTTAEGFYWECWHPETDSWEAMYPPVEGLGLYMSPGSKVRLVKGVRPEHTKNVPANVMAGTQMRDLLPS